MRPGSASIVLLALAGGCTVDVASLKLAAPQPISADVLRSASSCGWREGESCRFWLLGIPFGLPQVDEAMNNALHAVDGVYMRNLTVFSVHPTYLLFGWHCYRVLGEACGYPEKSSSASDDGAVHSATVGGP